MCQASFSVHHRLTYAANHVTPTRAAKRLLIVALGAEFSHNHTGRKEIAMIKNMPGMPQIQRLHHWAYKCRDAEETRHFYEDILDLPLIHVIRADTVPSTGVCDPYVHIFFAMPDGSSMAFFDLGDGQAPDLSANTPSWTNHMALHLDSVNDVMQAKARLEAHGIDVIGPTDHKFVISIYFFDPNGYRLELTHELSVEHADYIAVAKETAHSELDAWTAEKAATGGRASQTRQTV